jgi:hypothetical protein
MAWYEEVNGEDGRKMTRLSIVMRVDLGQDIPRWAFLLTVASTGITSMQKLQKYAKWRQL